MYAVYEQLRLLGRQYAWYIKMRINCKLNLVNLLDHTMPGIARTLEFFICTSK